MNKKRLNLFLVPLTIVLWIIILTRVVSFTRQGTGEVTADFTMTRNNDTVEVQEAPSLLLNYPDPFTPGRNLPDNSPAANTSVKNVSRDFFAKPPEPVLPALSFSGVIKTDNGDKTVGLLTVDGRSVLVSENDTLAGIRVLRCWPDSIRLMVKDRALTIRRN